MPPGMTLWLGMLILPLTGCSKPAPTIAAGRALYDANGCVSCHGPEGHGDGIAAATLPAKPVDFRDPAEFQRGTSEAEISKTLAEGISILHTMPALKTSHHMLVMPKYDHLTETERQALALYVISIRSTSVGRVNP